MKGLYYLDTFKYHRRTIKKDRVVIRRTLDRDKAMKKCLIIQHDECFYCGCNIGMDGHLDHVMPIYYGGSNKVSNLVASCRDCNLLKSTGQIEITSIRTIRKYKKMIKKYKKWANEVSRAIEENDEVAHGILITRPPKSYVDYRRFRADLFIKI